MSQIVSWEYYSSLHSKVSEDDFTKAEQQAEKAVCRVIGPIRWANITEETFGYEQLKDCICQVIDKMATDDEAGLGEGVASVSNDGYAETYTLQTAVQRASDLQTSIRLWLSGTGLVGAY